MVHKQNNPQLFTYLLFIFIMTGIGISLTNCNPYSEINIPHEPTSATTPGQKITPTTLMTNNSTGEGGNKYTEPVKIKLAWFYKPPISETNALEDNFSQFILTKNDESFREKLKSQGVQGPFFQYVLLNEINNPGGCNASPFNDQVAFQVNDFCWIEKKHPAWFLLDKSGNRMGSNNYPFMDDGNLEWRAFWLERVKNMQQDFGWDGVFLDNIEASISVFDQFGSTPAKYPDDASLQNLITSTLKNMYISYFLPNKRPLYGNIIGINNPDVPLRYLQYLDGAMLENFAVGWPGDPGLTPTDWENQMTWVTKAQNMGKSIILVAQGSQNDLKRQEFALASYLLVNEGNVSFRYTNNHNYDEIWLYPDYKLEIGIPLGHRYQQDGNWKRDFTKGSIEVDPLLRTSTITLK